MSNQIKDEHSADTPLDLTEDEPRHRRNFISITFYQIALRIGWIFKTESVIMPAALDSIGGSGWIRGCLPMLNRIGQSIPPLLVWPVIQQSRQQKHWLFGTTLAMGVLFCGLSSLWLTGFYESGRAAQVVFLTLYATFFVATGINQLTLSTLIGKLIRTTRRGRLMLAANVLGCFSSVACAWFILRGWLGDGDANFAAIFGCSGLCFISAATTPFFLNEPESTPVEKTKYRVRSIFAEVFYTFRNDPQFRLLAIVSGLFGMSMTLFPHYQNLARHRLELGYSSLLPWLIVQNIGVAVFSIPVGSVADRFGNRAVLRAIFVLLSLAPAIALIASTMTPALGQAGFMLTFFLLGLTPVTMRVLSNFALEFTDTENHPRYLAAQNLALAIPVIVSSALIGLIVDRLGFETAFAIVIACMLFGWYLTFRLHEPRKEN